MKTKTTLSRLYNFPGFRALARLKCGVFQDSHARVMELVRRKKKRFAQGVGIPQQVSTIIGFIVFEICLPAKLASFWSLNTGAWIARGVRL